MSDTTIRARLRKSSFSRGLDSAGTLELSNSTLLQLGTASSVDSFGYTPNIMTATSGPQHLELLVTSSPGLPAAPQSPSMLPDAPAARPWYYRLFSQPITDVLMIVGCIAVTFGAEETTPRHTYVLKETLYKHSYPYKDNSVPSWSVPVYSILGPCAFFVFHKYLFRRTYWDLYMLVVNFLVAVFLTGAITNAIKVPVGRLRPNFVHLCWPDNVPVWRDEDSYGGYAVCEQTKYASEIRKSFPSGHSSWSAAGLGYLSLFLLAQTRAYTGNGQAWRLVLSLLPACGAIAVGVTRVIDYWHHPSDVFFGLGLGFFIAFIVYRQLWPTLNAEDCDRCLYERSKPRRQPAKASPDV